MLNEEIFQLKAELRKRPKGNLLEMALSQKERKCLLGGVCPFLLEYQHILFCVSEVLGESCLVERLAKSEGRERQNGKEINFSLPLIEKIGKIPLSIEKKTTEFKVYCRDHVTHSTTLLGRVIERRIIERGNNLKDLLMKATKEYSDRVEDPSTIFLLAS